MNLLKLRNLHVTFKTEHKKVFAVRGVNFDLRKGEIVGIVGESGCGKSATAKALMRLIDVDDGQILFEDIDLAKLSEKQMQKVRGKRIGMIFQDPLSALNPTMKIGHQIIEAIRLHTNDSRTEAKQKAIDLLNQVGIPDAQLRYDQYPHELSGGMRQRVGIAIALSCDPQILIADEPTTALDVTIQAQILALLKELQHTRNMSIILITHDLSIV
ncbi:MAG: ABC transporter ATP-binding protein, partial [Chlamydiia bacterium]|nr:ABC transporter ATP-binding protein [Chlamydiia bacterium]